jgi:hypothetical protein
MNIEENNIKNRKGYTEFKDDKSIVSAEEEGNGSSPESPINESKYLP